MIKLLPGWYVCVVLALLLVLGGAYFDSWAMLVGALLVACLAAAFIR